MKKTILATLLLLTAPAVRAGVLTGTWNLRWFPSGRAEHRASQRVEAATIQDAADVVRDGISSRRRPGDHVILFFQELRDEAACSNLVACIGMTNLSVASVSAYREFDRRLGWQQEGIVSDLPVVDANFSYWRRSKKVLPPRGCTYALLDGGEDGLVACYCVHLKSNYGANKPEIRNLNTMKRELAAEQFLSMVKKPSAPDGRPVARVLLAGDFNTDPFSRQFEGERTTAMLAEAGFSNCFAGVPPTGRGTHPGNTRYPDSTLDFIFHRGFAAQTGCSLSPAVPLSDHRMVWLRLETSSRQGAPPPGF